MQQRPGLSTPISQTTSSPAPTSVRPIKVRVPVPMEMQQSYLEVKDAATQAVVTAIEVLSPANKRGEGRSQYDAKRRQVLSSQTNLIEIDLLRAEQSFLLEPDANSSHYRGLVSRASQRPLADLYAFSLTTAIPTLPSCGQKTAMSWWICRRLLDLYKQLGYDYFIDYSQAPPPPWCREDLESLSR
ncbi:MAG: DUF4058 family protein [Cyanobacteria bacterium P01_C01_bin.120]